MMNEKEYFHDTLKSHMVDILMVILIGCVGFVIYQDKKNTKKSMTQIQINKTMNDFTNVNTR